MVHFPKTLIITPPVTPTACANLIPRRTLHFEHVTFSMMIFMTPSEEVSTMIRTQIFQV